MMTQLLNSVEIPLESCVCGNNFKKNCTFVFCFTINRDPFNPSSVKCGDTIFVHLRNLETFFTKLHPKINNKYILVTHSGDKSAPREFAKFLNDEKLYAWFTQNMDIIHPKVYPIPIGLMGKPEARYQSIKAINQKNMGKNILCYSNFNIDTNPTTRVIVDNTFKNAVWVLHEKRCHPVLFFTKIAQSKFVLSPHGNGLDCYRTWETLLLNSYPIVKTSTLDALYTDLPVLIVHAWEDVTEEFLEKKYEEMRTKSYNYAKLSIDYWIDMIKKKQDECRAGS